MGKQVEGRCGLCGQVSRLTIQVPDTDGDRRRGNRSKDDNWP